MLFRGRRAWFLWNVTARHKQQHEHEQANDHGVPSCDAYIFHGAADAEHHVAPTSGHLDEKVDAHAGDEEGVLVLPQLKVARASVLRWFKN